MSADMSVEFQPDFSTTTLYSDDCFTVQRHFDLALNESWFTVIIPRAKPDNLLQAMHFFNDRSLTVLEAEVEGDVLYMDFA